jgi:hypothetical protein
MTELTQMYTSIDNESDDTWYKIRRCCTATPKFFILIGLAMICMIVIVLTSRDVDHSQLVNISDSSPESVNYRSFPRKIMFMRHGEKLPTDTYNLATQGYLRAVMYPIFFDNPPSPLIERPDAIFAPNPCDSHIASGRSIKGDRGFETAVPLIISSRIPFNNNFCANDHLGVINALSSIDLNNKVVAVFWEHTTIPDLVDALGAHFVNSWDWNPTLTGNTAYSEILYNMSWIVDRKDETFTLSVMKTFDVPHQDQSYGYSHSATSGLDTAIYQAIHEGKLINTTDTIHFKRSWIRYQSQ